MKQAVFGYTKIAEGSVCKHCSEECKFLHFGDPIEIPLQAHLVCLKMKQPRSDIILLQVTQSVSTELSNRTNTIFSIQLCLSCDNPKIPNNTPYANIQIRTIRKAYFLSYLLLPDFSPGEHLWFTKQLCDIDKLYYYVQHALKFGLERNNITDLSSLVKAFASP